MAVLNPVGDSVAVTPAPKKRRRACGACGEVGHRRDNEKCSKHIEHSTPRHDESKEQVQVSNKVPHDGGSEEREGETFGGRHTLTHECVCLTVSQNFQGWCPSTPAIKMAPTVPAASNGIMGIDEKPMHQTTQEELDVLERVALDENGVT